MDGFDLTSTCQAQHLLRPEYIGRFQRRVRLDKIDQRSVVIDHINLFSYSFSEK